VKLLLDTHCLLWALADPQALGTKGRKLIGDAEQVCFSEASIWELGLKWRKGKIGLEPRKIHAQAIDDGFQAAAVTVEHMLVSCELRGQLTDPFDRLLYAQARTGGFKLLSIDRGMRQLGTQIVSPR
jgi:PIN domain nuclease of toxin-antitoxin system